MKGKIIILSVAFVIISSSIYVVFSTLEKKKNSIDEKNITGSSETGMSKEGIQKKNDGFEVVTQDLEIPWEVLFLPDDEGMLVTQRTGTLLKIGKDNFSIEIDNVRVRGEGGLLGVALHPNFRQNRWIYLYYSTIRDGATTNEVVRYELNGSELKEEQTIISGIPGAVFHDGGRIAFGPDGFLYIGTGDAGKTNLAQDASSLAGKILRIGDDGEIPNDNPFGNAVYSYGHRNVQGLAWDEEGRLWATEHGPSGLQSGFDELNIIRKGANYGWPEIRGDESEAGMETPVINSGSSDTWAPSGAVFVDGSIFFAGLRGEALYEYRIADGELETHYKKKYGRLRGVGVGLDGNLIIYTNNKDGRGTPKSGDDKIIRIQKP